jgi:hypothetical protein
MISASRAPFRRPIDENRGGSDVAASHADSLAAIRVRREAVVLLLLLAGLAGIALLVATGQTVGLLGLIALLAALLVVPGLGYGTPVVLAVAALVGLPPVLAIAARPDDSAPLKAALILLAVGAAARAGARLDGWAFAWFGLWSGGLVLSILGPDPYDLGLPGHVQAFLGYTSGWAWLLVAVPRDGAARWLRLVERAPVACVATGLVLAVTGLAPLLQDDGSGVPRLGGSLIPPHLAMLAICGLVASMLRGRTGDTRGHWAWVVVNVAICFATVTRGAMAAAAVLVLVHLLGGLREARLARGRATAFWLLGAASLAAGAAVALRNQGNSYEGTYNTSGREQAWAFYAQVAGRFPWTGNGLGAAAVANEVERPPGVQAAFHSPHNEYVHLWLDAGAPLAVALFVVLLVLVVGRLSPVLGRVGAVSVAVALLLFAAIDNPLSTVQFTAPLAVLVSAAASLTASPDPERRR